MMKFLETSLQDCFAIEPTVFGDSRGFFMESFNQKKFNELLGTQHYFVQDNHSRSSKGVLRGLHYQIQNSQGKLVRVVHGAVFDVAVDLRKSSRTFGQWYGCVLSDENKKMLWIPPGFAHGFSVLSDTADFLYKTTDYYAPQFERTIIWNDVVLAIDWQIEGSPALSDKDKNGIPFKDAEVYS